MILYGLLFAEDDEDGGGGEDEEVDEEEDGSEEESDEEVGLKDIYRDDLEVSTKMPLDTEFNSK